MGVKYDSKMYLLVQFISGVIPAKAETWWDAAALVEWERSHWVPACAG